MGVIHVNATIRNLAEHEKCRAGRFLVDAGATDSVVSEYHLRAIGLQPEGTRRYELTDDTEVKLGIVAARIELLDTFMDGVVIFGEDDDEPILGVTAVVHRRRGRPAQSVLEAATSSTSEMAWGG